MNHASTGPDESGQSQRCPRCGTELAPGATADKCPKCLLAQALYATEKLEPPQAGAGQSGRSPISEIFVQPGQMLGRYRILRVLGGGGMGTVFEAEDTQDSRRVALKVLSHRLDAPEARERFFREGRLAAAINHPNSVYIFGTEEVAGVPVISMELVSGGTLQEAVHARGPMAPGAAVDAILQVIAGLEAAQTAGILHRDVKPSNCFVDTEGGVKVGDFGLSISTTVRTEPALTSDGAFLGTPAFCPPEQLRGEELNVRSDIYSVGATLFYLLTGRTPFQAANSVALIATVLERPAPVVRELRSDVSAGLSRVVQRCLDKRRTERFATYAELRAALEPYASAAPVPAGLGIRFLAGALDLLLTGLVIQLSVLLGYGSFLAVLEAIGRPGVEGMSIMAGGVLLVVCYYALLEGLWGTTPGKALCRLRVVGPGRSLPGLGRSFIRSLMWVCLPVLPFWVGLGFLQEGGWTATMQRSGFSPVMGQHPVAYYLLALTPYLVMGGLFSTARQKNMMAAVHDLASGTRVVVRSKTPVRPAVSLPEATVPKGEGIGVVGPYRVLETLGQNGGTTWFLGYDLRLLRKVWIRQNPSGTESFPKHLRNMARASRLRWLTGRRNGPENWDAFEAPQGAALLSMIQQPQPWEMVRYWLWDIARELEAAARDHTAPESLSLDRIWITADGAAKLLDFGVPGIPQEASARFPSFAPAQANEFLSHMAVSALEGQVTGEGQVSFPVALHARKVISQMQTAPSLDPTLFALAESVRKPATVTRLRRAALVGGCVAFPLLVSLGMLLGRGFLEDMQKRYPDVMGLNQVLAHRRATHMFSSAATRSQQLTDNQYAAYIAGQYGSLVTNSARWKSPIAASMISGGMRAFAEASVAKPPQVSPAEMERARQMLDPMSSGAIAAQAMTSRPIFQAMMFQTMLLMYAGIPALLAAVLFRGGLVVRVGKVAYVTRKGQMASRLRLLWRWIVCWAPASLAIALSAAALAGKSSSLAAGAMLVLLAGVACGLLPSKRGLQDVLSGTWPVTR